MTAARFRLFGAEWRHGNDECKDQASPLDVGYRFALHNCMGSDRPTYCGRLSMTEMRSLLTLRQQAIERDYEIAERYPIVPRSQRIGRNGQTRGAYPKVYERDEGICQICFEPVLFEEGSADHIIPWSRGGPSAQRNLRLTHRPCDQARSLFFVRYDLYAEKTSPKKALELLRFLSGDEVLTGAELSRREAERRGMSDIWHW